ncbi:hypothetical protein F4679DRAFT_556140 [Xylaria curta]|nr:hypothetical protein F4679DRAFT_556140 [Xylaria curta]
MAEQLHLFAELPIELRLKIWAHTWEPRTITLFPASGVYSLTDKNPLPTSAYVNSESRSETLQHYKRCFVHDFHWFNFRLDTLCIAVECRSEDLESLDPSDPRAVRALSNPFSSRLGNFLFRFEPRQYQPMRPSHKLAITDFECYRFDD